MNRARALTARIAVGVIFALAVAVGLAVLSTPFSPGSVIAAAGAGLLGFGFSRRILDASQKAFAAASGSRPSSQAGDFEFGTRETGRRDTTQDWLDAEERKHHKHLVDLFFSQLKNLRVAPSSRRPFRLDLFTLNLSAQALQLPIEGSLASLPLREESVSHLAAREYSPLSGAYGTLVDSVRAFNAKADSAVASLDLEGRMKRTFPTLRSEFEGRALTGENYYFSGNLWLALEKAAEGADVQQEITPSGAGLETMVPWAAGHKLVLAGFTVAHMKELHELEALQELIDGSTGKLKELIAERQSVQSGLEGPARTFGEEIRKLLEDFNLRQKLFGRCHVEETLEGHARSGRTIED